MTRSFLSAGILSGIAATLLAPAVLAAPTRNSPARKPAPARPAAAAQPADLKNLASVDIAPASFMLDGPRAGQHLVVLGTTKDGATLDLTDRVVYTFTNPRLARIEGGVVRPIADGKGSLVARVGKIASPPAGFSIVNAKAPSTIEFTNDVMPILARGGCNNTACHGSPAGKGGLKLSLFGYEPELDYQAIAKAAEGKRLDLKNPAGSMLLQKATMGTPHAGGMRFKKDSAEYATLLTWIKNGAQGIGELEARVKRVDIIPDQPWMPGVKARQRLAVTALMSDGTTRDVTDQALFSSNDDAIAEVTDAGLVTARRSGETAVMVRYLGQVGVARIAVLPAWKAPNLAGAPRNNYVDELVHAKLQQLRMTPSDPCTDEEFIRRVSLDVCGIIPTVDEVRAFLADRAPNKRARLIDQMLERPEFVDLWTVKWNDILRNNPRVTRTGAQSYAGWIREQLAKNRPYDEFVRELVTSSGRTTEGEVTVAQLPRQVQDSGRAQQIVNQLNRVEPNAAANYFAVSRDPLDVTSATSQVFLGVRIECARCHNHPFEKWTQNDYYALASFFHAINVRGNGQVPAVVTMNPRAPEIRNPKTNEPMEPKTLDLTEVKLERGEDRRTPLAGWLTSPENPWFARAIANRIWGHYLGRGVIEPVDDIRITNPASNPELLDALAKDVVDHKFDLKALHRSILNSRTYQQSSRPNQTNATDTANFARFYPKRMMAEQLYDSISQATDVFIGAGGRNGRRPGQALQMLQQAMGGRYGAGGVPADLKRVMQLAVLVPGIARGGGGDLAQFLDTFGKPKREVVCECERSAEGNIGQALTLINGDEVNAKISAPIGRAQRLIRANRTDAEVIEELYLATLSRRPIPMETSDAEGLFRSSRSRAEGIEDLLWSLLNAREFLFNH